MAIVAMTRYGFDWGPASVERCVSDAKYGVLVVVRGKRETASIRVTPSGLVRVSKAKTSKVKR